MEHPPLVSVIMPCYNMERFLPQTIASVVQQTFGDWELIIVDDASADGTVEVLQRASEQDQRIRWIAKTEHSGIADTRNRCLQMAQGRYLAFLDADDLWYPDKLQRQLRFMEEQGYCFSYTSYRLIDEEGKDLDKTVRVSGYLDYNAYLRNTIIGCSTVMIDREIVGEVKVPSFRTSEDTATWLDILKKGFTAHAFDEPLTSYRVRRKSASSNKMKASYDLWTVYRKHEKLPFFKTLYCFCHYAFNAVKKRL